MSCLKSNLEPGAVFCGFDNPRTGVGPNDLLILMWSGPVDGVVVYHFGNLGQCNGMAFGKSDCYQLTREECLSELIYVGHIRDPFTKFGWIKARKAIFDPVASRIQRLGTVYFDGWLNTPNPRLKGRKPNDFISDGKPGAVIELLEEMVSGKDNGTIQSTGPQWLGDERLFTIPPPTRGVL